MNNRQLPGLVNFLKEPDQPNRVPTKYRLWNGTADIYWDNINNWRGSGIPSGTSNVLFAGNSKAFPACSVNADISVKTLFVRRDFAGTDYLSFTSNRNVIVQKQIRIDSRNSTSFTSNNIVLSTGHFIIDSPAFLSLGQSNLNLSGNLRITQADPLDNLSTITYKNSGNYIYSVIPLNKINIINQVSISGSLVVKNRMNLSGAVCLDGGNLIFDGSQSKLNVGTGGWAYGAGEIVIQKNAVVERQSGYLDNARLTITDNILFTTLSPGTYSCRNVTFYSDNFTQDSISFGPGNYRFESNVQLVSIGGGLLRLDTSNYNTNIEFDKNIDVVRNSNNGSRVNWIPGAGTFKLGKPRTIAKEFQRFQYGLGATNIIDMSRGLVVSHQNIINEQPIIWLLNATGLAPVQINAITSDAHTVGGAYFTDVTGIQLGDLAYGRGALPGQNLYVGDIADTGANRALIYVYQATEPIVSGYGFTGYVTDRTWSGVYQTGNNIPLGELGTRSRDCRAMFMKYDSSDMFFISHKTNPPQLFYITGVTTHFNLETMFYLGQLKINSGVVGADISRDGRSILVKRWDEVFYYTVNGTGVSDVAFALTGTSPIKILDYNADYQEHGIAWGSGENSFHTIATFNSGLHDPLLRAPFYTYDKRATINLSGLTVDNLEIDASGHTKAFTSSGIFNSFALDNGLVDIGQQKLTSVGDFYVGPGGNFNRRGFNNAVITVGGDLLLVGSASRDLRMHPDTASGTWQLNVAGDAKAYYTSARASNASLGSTINAYTSYNYGDNTNWNFGGAPQSSGNLNLYIQGAPSTTTYSGGISLGLYGKIGDTTGTLFLYVSGGTPAPSSGELYLWVSGSPNIVTNSLPLYLHNSSNTESVPLVIHGRDYASGGVLYLIVKQDGVGSDLSLYTVGSIPTGGNMELSIVGSSPISSGLDLYLSANGIVNSTATRLYVHGRHIT